MFVLNMLCNLLMWLSLLSVWLGICEELSGVYKAEAACGLGWGCWGGEGVAQLCCLGDVAAPSLLFPLEPEALETFSVILRIGVSPILFSS